MDFVLTSASSGTFMGFYQKTYRKNNRYRRERELLEVKKKITDSDFITRLIETILTRMSNISSETNQWEAAAGLIAASVQLLNYCSEKQINLLCDLSFEHLDHQGLELYFFWYILLRLHTMTSCLTYIT